jgi:wyosine [tRNA(Phe)-imidazoG37] synthetase (radical SAM superfamily)
MSPNPPRVLDYSDHSRALGANRYVYAVISRRAGGLSIGLNLNPDKVCNFGCRYCQVDRKTPARWTQVDLELLTEELDRMLALAAGGDLWRTPPFDTVAPALRTVADISLAGDGEPTSCRLFADVIAQCGVLRERHGLGSLPIHVLTNATLFDRPGVQAGLHTLAELGGDIWAKLDAGTAPYFEQVVKTSIGFDHVLANLHWAATRWPLIIQTLFCRIDGQDPSDAEAAAWARHLHDIVSSGGQIDHVQLTTVQRRPEDPRCLAVPAYRLQEIADHGRAHALDIRVYPGSWGAEAQ